MNRPRGLIAALLLSGAGCASAPAPRTYVLTPPSGATAVPVPDSGQPRVQLQPVLLPDYLDTTDLLLRSGPNELKVSHSARWGERLSQGLTDALSAALAARLSRDFVTFNQGDERPARQILVDVAAFDLWPNGHCVLIADWTVLEKDTHSVIGSGRAVLEIPPTGPGAADDAALVAAMARAVGELADRLAKEVLRPAVSTLRPRVDNAGRPVDFAAGFDRPVDWRSDITDRPAGHLIRGIELPLDAGSAASSPK